MHTPLLALSTNTHKFQQQVVINGKVYKVCEKSWSFAHGINEGQLKAHKKNRKLRMTPGFQRVKLSKKKLKKRDVKPKTPGDHEWVVWFNHLRLPYVYKKDVYDIYADYFHTFSEHTTASNIIQYQRALEMWKYFDGLKHIKLSKVKCGFSKCEECYHFKDLLHQCSDKLEREHIKRQHEAHIELTRKERQQYYEAKVMANLNPEEYICIIIDAMDSNKTHFSFWPNPPKSVDGMHQVKTKLIACMVHGF
mmetsp:Transcript_28301/g.36560  ORF Transcript_28301/g.36560 Transcript_28301/m.36560 type:complete len:250 (-) Transcript_28301:173-922(-)